MAVTIVATPGDGDANSYLTLADATAILEGYLTDITSCWDAATEPTKNIALVQATRDIDTLRLKGEKYNTGKLGSDDYQPLHFPTGDDIYDSALQIPEVVERATALQAAYLLRSGSSQRAISDMVSSGIVSHRTGRLSQTVNPYEVSRVCPEAIAELNEWILKSIKIERG